MGKTTMDYLRTIYKSDAQQWFDFRLRCEIENHYGGIFCIINLCFSQNLQSLLTPFRVENWPFATFTDGFGWEENKNFSDYVFPNPSS